MLGPLAWPTASHGGPYFAGLQLDRKRKRQRNPRVSVAALAGSAKDLARREDAACRARRRLRPLGLGLLDLWGRCLFGHAPVGFSARRLRLLAANWAFTARIIHYSAAGAAGQWRCVGPNARFARSMCSAHSGRSLVCGPNFHLAATKIIGSLDRVHLVAPK